MTEEIQEKVRQLRNLVQYRNKSELELIEIAKQKLAEEVKSQKLYKLCDNIPLLNNKERDLYIGLYKSYQEFYDLTDISDEELLKDLCWLEVQKLRIQQGITDKLDQSKSKKIKKGSGFNYKTLDEVIDKILVLKERLGLFQKKEDSFLTFWERLKKKAQLYAEKNRGACTFKCPHCGEFSLLLKKIDNMETFKAEAFQGTYIYNKHAYRLLDEGKLTQEDIAKFYGHSTDYVKLIYKKLYLPNRIKIKETK